jgi:GWxTD domain-containing protein
VINLFYFKQYKRKLVKKLVLFVFSLTIISFLFCSCFGVKVTNNEKKTGLGSVYNPYVQQLHPQYFIYNSSKVQSRLYVKLNLSELMFSPIGPNRSYISKIKISYKVFPIDNSENFVDSASVDFEIRKKKGENSAISYVNINDKGLNKYYLQIITIDQYKQSKAEDFITVNREDEGNCQDFLVNINSVNYPYFNNFFSKDLSFTIQLNKIVDSLYIRYFKAQVPLPQPPFSSMARSEMYKVSDTCWSISGQSQFEFSQKKTGFYYIQTDTTLKYGLGLLNCGNDYPYIKWSENLMYPLEYLMSTAEFNELKKSDNKKLAVDEFWIKCGKNTKRARELIRIYYNRTFYANVYFTSHTEGWRTDRGMIYIIFGPPKSVKKSPNQEIWFYYDKSNIKYLQFVFNKYTNPYSQNDFELQRHIDFKAFWFKAIESWRDGKVFTVFD